MIATTRRSIFFTSVFRYSDCFNVKIFIPWKIMIVRSGTMKVKKTSTRLMFFREMDCKGIFLQTARAMERNQIRMIMKTREDFRRIVLALRGRERMTNRTMERRETERLEAM